MRFPENIGKSGFHRGEYVGYGRVTYRVKRNGNGWLAIARGATGIYPASFSGATLAEISRKLDAMPAWTAEAAAAWTREILEA